MTQNRQPHCYKFQWPAWPHDLPHVDSSQVKAAIPELRKTRGRILLTSSGGAIAGYATWGAYGSSKAAMNHLALTLNTEEPDITSIAIRPGVVDTEMQRELREVHHERLDKKDKEKFMSAKASGTCKLMKSTPFLHSVEK